MTFLSEKDSIDYFVKCLQASGYTNINTTQKDDEFCCYDITATNPINHKHLLFELKARDCFSTTYGDNMIEDIKYRELLRRIQDREFDNGYIINLFFDQWTSSSLDGLTKKFWALCPRTTKFSTTEKVPKLLCSFKRERSWAYE